MFQARYVKEEELKPLGLPTTDSVPNVMTLIDRASTLIDEYCGRRTEANEGSILYSTYEETLPIRPGRGNCVRLSYRPLVVITPTTQQAIALTGQAEVGPEGEDYYNTGFTPNSVVLSDKVTLSPIHSLQGFYGWPGYYQQTIPSIIAAPVILGLGLPLYFDGYGQPPAPDTVSIPDTNVNLVTGDIWVPAGQYAIPYREIKIRYNAGYDPLNVPYAVKFATASLVRNLIARGGGTTGLKGYSGAGRMTMNFTDSLIDDTIDLWLRKYKVVVVR